MGVPVSNHSSFDKSSDNYNYYYDSYRPLLTVADFLTSILSVSLPFETWLC
jgi:hypothetical protein